MRACLFRFADPGSELERLQSLVAAACTGIVVECLGQGLVGSGSCALPQVVWTAAALAEHGGGAGLQDRVLTVVDGADPEQVLEVFGRGDAETVLLVAVGVERGRLRERLCRRLEGARRWGAEASVCSAGAELDVDTVWMLAYHSAGMTRRDSVGSFDPEQIVERGAYGVVRWDQLFGELAYRLGCVGKYGA